MEQKRKKYPVLLAAVLAAVMGMTGCTKSKTHTNKGAAAQDNGNISQEFIDSTAQSGGLAESDSGEGDTVSAKGRYVETEIEISEGFSGPCCMQRLSDAKESLVLLDFGRFKVCTSTDHGKTWEEKTIEGLEKMWDEKKVLNIFSAAVSPQGDVFFDCHVNKDNMSAAMQVYFSLDEPEKTMKTFVAETKDKGELLAEPVFTEDGRLFALSTTDNVYEVYPEKETCRYLFTLDDVASDLCSNGEFLIAADQKKIYFYDLESGETEAEDEVLNAYVAGQAGKTFGLAMCAGSKERKTLYLAGCNGIAGHGKDGSVMEQLVDGALSSLGDPAKMPQDILQNEDGSFFVLFQDGELYSYVYDKEALAVPEEQLTVYSLYDNETVRKAVSTFRKQHPEVFVRFETSLSAAGGMTRSDAVKNLNTQLLAEKGPDLIILDGLPLQSYEEKGILEDLSALAKEFADSGNYFQGILNGFQTENGIFALPFRCQVPLLEGESSVLSNITDLKSLADAAETLSELSTTQETVLGTYWPEETLEKLYLTSANAWTNEQGDVNQEALQDFLEQAKRIYQADQKNLDAQELDAHREYTEFIQRHYQNKDKEAQRVLSSIAQCHLHIPQRQLLTAGYLSSMEDFSVMLSIRKELEKNNISLQHQVWNGQDAEQFVPAGTVGISIHSRQKALAEDFIRVLLGDDVQGKDFRDGFPVNAAAFEPYAAYTMEENRNGVTGEEDRDGNVVAYSTIWPDKQELEQLKALLDTLDTPAVFEEDLKNELITIGAQALRGEKKVEESAKEIAQKISLYLRE